VPPRHESIHYTTYKRDSTMCMNPIRFQFCADHSLPPVPKRCLRRPVTTTILPIVHMPHAGQSSGVLAGHGSVVPSPGDYLDDPRLTS